MTKQQDKYVRKSRDKQDLEKALNKLTFQNAKRLIEDNPQWKGLKVKPMTFAYIPSPPEKKEAVMRLVEAMIADRKCEKKQNEMLKDVLQSFPTLKLHNSVWSVKLNKGTSKKIQEKITSNMAQPISIDGCKNLSDIRKRFKVAYLGRAETATVKGTFIFSRDAIVVNGKPHLFVKKSAKKKTYKIIKFKKAGVTYEIRAKALAVLLSTTS